MVINKIFIKNYKSIGEAGKWFEFSEAGLNLIRGNPGSGKTLIMSAVTFAIYGINPDEKGAGKARLPTSKLINDINKKDLYTEVHLSNGYIIKRGLKPNIFEIEKDGKNLAESSAKKIDDEFVVKYCLEGLSITEFLKTAFLSDRVSSSPFLYMSKTDRKNYIEDILNLRRIPILVDHLKTIQNESELKYNSLVTKKSLLENSISNETTNLENQESKKLEVQQKIKDFHSNRETRIEAINKDIQNLENDLVPYKENRLKTLQDNIKSKTLLAEETIKNNKIEITNDIDTNKKILEELEDNHKVKLKTQLDNYKQQIKEDKVKLDKELEDNKQLLKDLQFKYEFMTEDIDNRTASKVKVDLDEYNSIKNELSDLRTNIQNLKTSIIQHKSKYTAWEEASEGTTICEHCNKETSIKAKFDLDEYNKIKDDYKNKYIEMTANESKLLKRLTKLDEDIASNNNIQSEIDELMSEYVSAKSKIESYTNTDKMLQDKKDNFNEVIKSNIDNIKSSLKKDLDYKLETTEKTIKDLENKLESNIKNTETNLTNAIANLNREYKTEVDNFTNSINNSINSKKEMLESIKNEIEPLPIEVDYSYKTKLENDMKQLLIDIDKEYNNKSELKVMKEVILDKKHKKKALESYLPLFESKLNSLVERFFEDAEFTLKVEMKEDFEIVFKKNGKEITVFELSSGQKQMCVLAVTFAFLYLLQLKHKSRLNILLIDEIVDEKLGNQVHLIVEYLKELSENTNVTLISHSTTLPYELFDSVTSVEKDGPFSKYIKE